MSNSLRRYYIARHDYTISKGGINDKWQKVLQPFGIRLIPQQWGHYKAPCACGSLLLMMKNKFGVRKQRKVLLKVSSS